MDILTKYWLFYLLSFFSEVIGTISGFGSSILFVPLATLFFDFDLVLAITAIFHVFSNSFKIGLFRKGFNKRIAIYLGIPAVIFVSIGALLTSYFPQKTMEIAMNIVLVALAIYLLYNSQRQLKDSNKNLILGGISSGFLAGLIGTGGAIRGLVLTAFNLEKELFIATSAVIDFGVDITRAGIYIMEGYFQWQYAIILPFLILTSFLGTWVGKRILNYVSQKSFRYLVLTTICVTAGIQVYMLFYSK